MLIVRGVNVFPTAVREVVGEFTPAVSGQIAVRPSDAGVKQEPPLSISVELAADVSPEPGLAGAIEKRVREALVVRVEVDLLPWGSLQRSEYKSRLLDR
jgi:phenylacetate-CoA ligase